MTLLARKLKDTLSAYSKAHETEQDQKKTKKILADLEKGKTDAERK